MTVRIGKSVIASLAVALVAVWYMTSGVAPAQAGVIGAAGIGPAFAAANADQGHTLVRSRHGREFGRHGGFHLVLILSILAAANRLERGLGWSAHT